MIKTGAKFGKYTLLDRLAAGGMAEIFKARVDQAGAPQRIVAIKRLHRQFSEDQEFVTMLVDEAKLAVQLQHPNIGEVFDLERIDGQYFIVMEFINGLDLKELAECATGQNRRLPLESLVYVAAQAASALHYAHNKVGADGRSLDIVHRDVSPQNIMLSVEGSVKLVDFGIAKARKRAQHTRAGVIKGKFYYMSPEQAHGNEVDGRSDLYALGMVLYEILTGEHPFESVPDGELLRKVRMAQFPPIAKVRPQLPRRMASIIDRALSRDKAKRFQNAQQMQQALEGFAAEELPQFRQPQLAQLVRHYTAKHLPEETRGANFKALGSGEHVASEHSLIFDPQAYNQVGAMGEFEGDATQVFRRGNDDARQSPSTDDLDADGRTSLLGWDEQQNGGQQVDQSQDHHQPGGRAQNRSSGAQPVSGGGRAQNRSSGAQPVSGRGQAQNRSSGAHAQRSATDQRSADDLERSRNWSSGAHRQLPQSRSEGPGAADQKSYESPQSPPAMSTGSGRGASQSPSSSRFAASSDEATAGGDGSNNDLSGAVRSPSHEPPPGLVQTGASPQQRTSTEQIHKRIATGIITRFDRIYRRRPHAVGGGLAGLAVILLGLSAWLVLAPDDEQEQDDWHADIAGEPVEADEDGAIALPVSTNPANARVYLDDDFQGQTPLSLESLEPGQSYVLRFERDGYEAKELNIVAEVGMTPRVVRLEPLGGVIRVETEPEGGEIFLDGQSQGQAPVTMMGLERELTYEVEARHSDDETQSESVTWSDGDERVRELTFEFDVEEEEEVAQAQRRPRRQRSRSRPSRTRQAQQGSSSSGTSSGSSQSARDSSSSGSGSEGGTTTQNLVPTQEPSPSERDEGSGGGDDGLDIWGIGEEEAQGRLNVRVDADHARIYVDGNMVKDGTDLIGHPLDAGSYEVRVFFPGSDLSVDPRTVQVRPGETSTVMFNP